MSNLIDRIRAGRLTEFTLGGHTFTAVDRVRYESGPVVLYVDEDLSEDHLELAQIAATACSKENTINVNSTSIRVNSRRGGISTVVVRRPSLPMLHQLRKYRSKLFFTVELERIPSELLATIWPCAYMVIITSQVRMPFVSGLDLISVLEVIEQLIDAGVEIV